MPPGSLGSVSMSGTGRSVRRRASENGLRSEIEVVSYEHQAVHDFSGCQVFRQNRKFLVCESESICCVGSRALKQRADAPLPSCNLPFYNHARLHSSLHYVSPATYEKQLARKPGVN